MNRIFITLNVSNIIKINVKVGSVLWYLVAKHFIPASDKTVICLLRLLQFQLLIEVSSISRLAFLKKHQDIFVLGFSLVENLPVGSFSIDYNMKNAV